MCIVFRKGWLPGAGSIVGSGNAPGMADVRPRQLPCMSLVDGLSRSAASASRPAPEIEAEREDCASVGEP